MKCDYPCPLFELGGCKEGLVAPDCMREEGASTKTKSCARQGRNDPPPFAHQGVSMMEQKHYNSPRRATIQTFGTGSSCCRGQMDDVLPSIGNQFLGETRHLETST